MSSDPELQRRRDSTNAISAFMSLTKVQLGIVAALLVGALGTLEWQHESEASIRRQLDATLAELSRIRSESARRIVPNRQAAVQPRTKPRPAVAGSGPSNTKAASSDDKNRLQSVLSDLRIRYARFIRKHGMTPEQGERLVELLAEKQWLDADLRASAKAQGMANPQVNALVRSSDAPINQDIQNLLSPEADADLVSYEESSFIQTAFVDRLADRFSEGGAPLTADQIDQLTAIVQANMHSVPISPSFGNEAIIDWQNVGRQAGNVLAPEQAQVLRSSIDALTQQQADNVVRLKGLHPN